MSGSHAQWCDADRTTNQRGYDQTLLTNAIKYNDKAEKWLKSAVPNQAMEILTPPGCTFFVRDNGHWHPAQHWSGVFRFSNV